MLPAGVKESIDQKSRQLFASYRIPDIKQIEVKTRADVEEKRQQLRHVIGHRYRDIIRSADSIHIMKNAAAKLSTQLKTISSNAQPDKHALEAQSVDNAFASQKLRLARMVKWIALSAETIWSALDKADYLGATLAYLQTERVYKAFVADKTNQKLDPRTRELASSMVIVDGQWAHTSKLSERIVSEARQRLSVNDLTEVEYVSAVVSLMILDKRSPTQAFMEFIDKRKQALTSKLLKLSNRAFLQKHQGDEEDSRTLLVTAALRAFTRGVQTTVYQIGCLFVKYPFDSFDGLLNEAQLAKLRQNTTQQLPLVYATYNSLWEQLQAPPAEGLVGLGTNTERKSQLITIASDTIRNLCFDWVKGFSRIMSADLFSLITSCHGLSEVESAVITQLAKPYSHLNLPRTASSSSFQGGALSRSGSFSSSTSLAGSTTSLTMSASQTDLSQPDSYNSLSWRAVCAVVMSNEIDLWEALFHQPLVERAKLIIKSAFSAISLDDKLEESLRGLMDSGRKGATEIHNVSEFIWETQTDFTPADAKERAFGSTQGIKSIVSELDAKLSRVMDDLGEFMVEKRNSIAPSKKLDAKEVKQQAQDSCFEFVVVLTKQLEARIDTLLQATTSTPSTSTIPVYLIDQALTIARLARLISAQSQQIKSILFAPDSSDSVVGLGLSSKTQRLLEKLAVSSPVKQNSASAAAGRGSLHSRATHLLDGVYFDGHIVWVNHCAKMLDGRFKAQLLKEFIDVADSVALSTKIRMSWLETKITDGVENPAEDFVPHQPSQMITQFLQLVSGEIHRAGAHVIDKPIIELLMHELSKRLFSTVSDIITTNTLNKEAVVQVWFDTKYLFDVLSNRVVSSALLRERTLSKPSTADGFIVARAEPMDDVEEIIAWKKDVDMLISKLKAVLDPIDVAFYAPHITKHTKSSYQRTYFLLGLLTLGSTAPLGLTSSSSTLQLDSSSAASPANILPCIPSASRFSLLPIATTTSSNVGGAGSAPGSPTPSKLVSSSSSNSLNSGATAPKPATSAPKVAAPSATKTHSRQGSQSSPGGLLGKISEKASSWFS